MRDLRLPTTVLCLMASALCCAQKQVVLGKLAQATDTVAVYSSTQANKRVLQWVHPKERMVIRYTSDRNWVAVLFRSGHYGYADESKVEELPYTVMSKPSSRSSSLASRGASSGRGMLMTDYAIQFTGTPYEWGGNDLLSGIDCSGFVKQIKGTVGIHLPRTAAEQSTVGEPVTRLEDLRRGDRLYFKEKGQKKVSHTGLYLGNGYFIHSSHGKGGVTTDRLAGGWLKMLVSARHDES